MRVFGNVLVARTSSRIVTSSRRSEETKMSQKSVQNQPHQRAIYAVAIVSWSSPSIARFAQARFLRLALYVPGRADSRPPWSSLTPLY